MEGKNARVSHFCFNFSALRAPSSAGRQLLQDALGHARAYDQPSPTRGSSTKTAAAAAAAAAACGFRGGARRPWPRHAHQILWQCPLRCHAHQLAAASALRTVHSLLSPAAGKHLRGLTTTAASQPWGAWGGAWSGLAARNPGSRLLFVLESGLCEETYVCAASLLLALLTLGEARRGEPRACRQAHGQRRAREGRPAHGACGPLAGEHRQVQG